MAHRPLVVLVSVGSRRPSGGTYPPFGRFKGTNDRSGGEIPPKLVPHHRMEWYGVVRCPPEERHGGGEPPSGLGSSPAQGSASWPGPAAVGPSSPRTE